VYCFLFPPPVLWTPPPKGDIAHLIGGCSPLGENPQLAEEGECLIICKCTIINEKSHSKERLELFNSLSFEKKMSSTRLSKF